MNSKPDFVQVEVESTRFLTFANYLLGVIHTPSSCSRSFFDLEGAFSSVDRTALFIAVHQKGMSDKFGSFLLALCFVLRVAWGYMVVDSSTVSRLTRTPNLLRPYVVRRFNFHDHGCRFSIK